jgi:hypothetical protein
MRFPHFRVEGNQMVNPRTCFVDFIVSGKGRGHHSESSHISARMSDLTRPQEQYKSEHQ